MNQLTRIVPIALAGAAIIATGLARPALSASLPSAAPFNYTGPLTSLVADGKSAAPVTGKLGFGLTVNADKTITPSKIDLTVPGATGPLSLQFTGATYVDGKLAGTVRLVNGSASVLEGLRLDFTTATETYLGWGDYLDRVKKTRPQPATVGSPLFFGDLAKGESSADLPFSVAVLTGKESISLTVNGMVTGERYIGAFDVAHVPHPLAIDTDRLGRVYIADADGQQVIRTKPDGTGPAQFLKFGTPVTGFAVDRPKDLIYATQRQVGFVERFTSGGRRMDPYGSAPDEMAWLRIGPDDAVYGIGAGGAVYRHHLDDEPDLKLVVVDKTAMKGISVDADAAGNVWIVNDIDKSVYEVPLAGSPITKVTTGPDWHLGGTADPTCVRVDALGEAFVGDAGTAAEPARITVFDSKGNVVRVFGRGGKASAATGLLDGQVSSPLDMAFGPNGTLYVMQKNDGGQTVHLGLMFAPF